MNILAFFAHPDDETMLAGGTLILLAQSGVNVNYLCATRGEGGEVGKPPICSIEELGRVREREMKCAVEVLGSSSLAFLDYQDPSIGPGDQLYAYTDDLNRLSDQLTCKITDLDIDAVITHGVNGEYGHPGHIISHRAANLAVTCIGDGAPSLYSVAASFTGHPKPRITNRDEPADIILDVSSVLGIKTAAAMCHRTQHALFVRRASAAAGRQMTVPEVILNLESIHRVLPHYSIDDNDPLFDRLKSWTINSERKNRTTH